MKFNDWFNIESENPPPGFDKLIVSSSHYLSIYVIFSLLIKIQKHLGLEAMLEYLELFMKKYAHAYPRKKDLIDKEIKKINVIEMYKNAMNP